MTFRSFLVLAVSIALLLAACGSEEPAGLDGFDVTEVTIDGQRMAVAVADTPELRSRGLMGVNNLGGLDGMLFVFEKTTDAGFWMKNTLIPLDIAFFDTSGDYVDSFTMDPCTEDPCPVYHPSGAYRYAVETPAGDLSFVGESAVLELADT